MARPHNQWTYNYETLAALTGLARDTVYQHKSRGYFDPNDFKSVILYAIEYGGIELQQEAMELTLRSRHQRGTAAKAAKAKKRA